MARRDYNTHIRSGTPGRIRYHRSWRTPGEYFYVNIISGDNFGYSAGKFFRQKPSVITNDNSAGLFAITDYLITYCLRQTADVVEGKSFSNNRSPTTCSELYDVLLFILH